MNRARLVAAATGTLAVLYALTGNPWTAATLAAYATYRYLTAPPAEASR